MLCYFSGFYIGSDVLLLSPLVISVLVSLIFDISLDPLINVSEVGYFILLWITNLLYLRRKFIDQIEVYFKRLFVIFNEW